MSGTGDATGVEVGWNAGALGAVHWLAVVLAAVSGAVHVLLFVETGGVPFLVAGVVFFLAIVALLFNVYPLVLYALGIPFVAGQIVLWVLADTPRMELALIDKPVQGALLVVLAYLLYTTWLARQRELMR